MSILISYSQPVTSPNVKCISVAPTGDVTLTWVIPPDPGGNFVDYKIFSSLAVAGPYSLVSTITTYGQNSITVIGAGANTKRVYYLVQTDYNPGPVISLPLDTFSTIFLKVTNNVSTAKLDWNKISVQNIPTSSGWYKIYREFPSGSGNWVLRDSTQSLTYTDVIDVCNKTNDTINYQVKIADNTGCISVSNTDGGVFHDQTYPIISPIDTVSVNAAGKATISWYLSPSPDADSIIIYKANAVGGWVYLTSVPVPLTFYLNNLSTASTGLERYRIAFRDSCGNLSPLGVEHKTIFLTASVNICAATASLSWNSYINMNSAVTQYKILRSVNGGPYTLLATNAANDTTYTDTGLALGSSYCYLIRAVDASNKTSTSNKACFNASVSQPPQYNYNRYATVISDKSIDIKAHVDPTATSVKYYTIERAINGSGVFITIATLPPPAVNVLSQTDNGVNTDLNSYVYKWNAIDSCGHLIMASNFDTTMLLTAQIAPNLNIDLSWNDYGSWLGKVDHYDIYRAVDGVWNPSPIGTASFTGTGGTYTDTTIVAYFSSKGIFSYKVVAKEGNGNAFGYIDSSVSNTTILYEYPKIYVPNCFTPNGDHK
ncbi:MAG TPA: fibronectin type III domain-containing protein, partial [Bacteroidia bacterium]